MRCARLDQDCPRPECPGRQDSGACTHVAALNAWRTVPRAEQLRRLQTPDHRAVLALVAACPDRGSVLPVSLQPECGCAELTECRAGHGKVRGRVTLANCRDCRAALSAS